MQGNTATGLLIVDDQNQDSLPYQYDPDNSLLFQDYFLSNDSIITTRPLRHLGPEGVHIGMAGVEGQHHEGGRRSMDDTLSYSATYGPWVSTRSPFHMVPILPTCPLAEVSGHSSIF